MSDTEQTTEVMRDARGRAIMSDRTSDIFARGKSSFRWPQPWPFLSPAVDWLADARERHPPADPESTAVQAAREDLLQTLAELPTSYWLSDVVQRQLHQRHGIGIRNARRLLRSCGVMAQPGIWSSQEAAEVWPIVRHEVHAALQADALTTVAELEAGLDIEVNVEMVFAALSALCWDGFAVVVRGREDEPLYFVRSRRGRYADYSDLYQVRTQQNAPQPAA